MIIRAFFKHVNAAIDFMHSLPELKQYSKKIHKMFDSLFNYVLVNNIPLDAELEVLQNAVKNINTSTKNEWNYNFCYLIRMLLLGLYVEEGMSVTEAYNITIGPYEHNILQILAKAILRQDRYFRKMTSYEVDDLHTLKTISL